MLSLVKVIPIFPNIEIVPVSSIFLNQRIIKSKNEGGKS